MSTIDEVAVKAGVSTATVSRTFRQPELLAAGTRHRVLEAAKELGYAPRRAGRPLRRASSLDAKPPESIGFQFFAAGPGDTLQSNHFYASMLMGAQQEAAAHGLNVLIHTTDRLLLARELPKMVLDQSIAGMLLVGAGGDPDTLNLFAEHVPHIVLLDDRDTSGRVECITSDGFGGAWAATRYLLGLGHRRIAFFLAEDNVRSFQDRRHGYFCALVDAGIPPDRALVVGGAIEDAPEERAARLRAMMQAPNAPTALLASNDEYAIFALRALRNMGLAVPGDVSVAGFDDIPFSGQTDPPLTTVRVDKEAMGRLAVHRLVARMSSPEEATLHPVCSLMPVSLVERESCRRV